MDLENEMNIEENSLSWQRDNRESVLQAHQRKKRGAPFKGKVSDNKEEKFRVQRQQIIRRFKTYFEQRLFDRTEKVKKRKKVFTNHEDLEKNQLRIS